MTKIRLPRKDWNRVVSFRATLGLGLVLVLVLVLELVIRVSFSVNSNPNPNLTLKQPLGSIPFSVIWFWSIQFSHKPHLPTLAEFK